MSGEFINLLAVAALCGAVVAVAEAVTVPLLRRAAIIDVPGHRSAHALPTPRGGGILLSLLGATGLVGNPALRAATGLAGVAFVVYLRSPTLFDRRAARAEAR
jgi:UDP-GlcNAc:undecaprenyl-phosphate GlcNAc-1-phosphate transferase